MAKGLGNGAQPISALLLSHNVANVIIDGSGEFIHGQTYQDMPVTAAASIEVLKILTERNSKVLKNGLKQGIYLKESLKKELSSHPNVGDIRGTGLFIGIEFVENKITKESFNKKLKVSTSIAELGLTDPYNISFYPCSGINDSYSGDGAMIAPPLTVKKHEIDLIVKQFSTLVKDYFNKNSL